LQAVGFAYMLSLMGSDLSLPMTVFIFFFATLAGAASMIPGGLGRQEAMMMGLLTLNGTGNAQANVATVIFTRGSALVVEVGLCLPLIPPSLAAPPEPQTSREP